MFAAREVPGSHEVDACIVAAADAVQREGGGTEGSLNDILVVCAYVGRSGRRERSPLCVDEEGGEVMMVCRWVWWRGGELEETAREGMQLTMTLAASDRGEIESEEGIKRTM